MTTKQGHEGVAALRAASGAFVAELEAVAKMYASHTRLLEACKFAKPWCTSHQAFQVLASAINAAPAAEGGGA